MLSNGAKVLQDKDRKNNISVFRIKGEIREKPDLICIKRTSYPPYLKYNTVIEVKKGDNSAYLGKKSNIINYFENYCDEKTKYYDEKGELLEIDNFVLATNFSPEGRLKEFEELHIDSERRKICGENGWLPIIEYSDTFNIVRKGIWDNINNDIYRNQNIGVGLLLSTKLGYKKKNFYWNNFEHNGRAPALQLKKPNPNNLTKNGVPKWRFIWCPI